VGNKPLICVPIINNDIAAVKRIEAFADLFEVRIDLIGKSWQDIAVQLTRPWIACNRRVEEGGKSKGKEEDRIKELLHALKLGAKIIDIELSTPGLAKVVKDIKGKAECLISYHNNKETPVEKLRDITRQQLDAGADICKVVTTARTFTDNVAILHLIQEFPGTKIVAFAMGTVGQISRVLCPMVGSYFTYASMAEGKESADGQIPVNELVKIYQMLRGD
jgi:3-dehydroquinate dehydratase-1